MAWRFKASKYKNAAPKASKPESWIRDLNIGSHNTHGNLIKASAALLAFHTDVGTGLIVLPITDSGRKPKLMPVLQAHRDLVLDFDFSPFDDGLLATCGEDSAVKLWHIPETGLSASTSDSECSFTCQHKRVEVVQFHPAADFLLASTAAQSVSLWDVLYGKEIYYNKTDHDDTVQSLSWKKDGSLFVTSCKDKQVRVVDPRAGKIVEQTKSHENPKDSRAVWLGDGNRILTSGFDNSRLREVHIRDIRNFDSAEKTLCFDSAVGILLPLFDADTNMLFLAGKADTSISYMEVTDKDPYLVEGIKFTGEQTKGACLVPKRALNVMECEVNRVLQLTSSAVVPVSYFVPRKSYRDFHGDLFPETSGYDSTLLPRLWQQGINEPVPKISLDPNVENAKKIKIIRPVLSQRLKDIESSNMRSNENHNNGDIVVVPKAAPRPEPKPRRKSATSESSDDCSTAPIPKPRITTKPPQNILAPRPYAPPRVSNVLRPVGLPRSLSEDPSVVSNIQNEQNGVKSSKDKEEIEIDENNSNQRRKMYERRIQSVQEHTDTAEEEENVPFKRTPSIAERRKMYETNADGQKSPQFSRRSKIEVAEVQEEPVSTRKFTQRQSGSESKWDSSNKKENIPPPSPAPMPKRTNTVFGRVSKYRHLKGTTLHKSTHIENIKNINKSLPGECDVVYGNAERVAVTLSGPGGKIAVFELSKPGKVPDGVTPALVHGTKVMDFAWDPFDYHRIVAGCDDGKIWVWTIPEGGLTEQTNQPEFALEAHTEKIYFVKFHPLAKDVLASASYDLTIRIWDLNTQQEAITIDGLADQIFSFSWSPCGQQFATACKDGKLRIYNPRYAANPMVEAKGLAGVRGGRVVWAVDGQFLVVTGFDRSSERQIAVFRTDDLALLNTVGLDVSPAILVPFYDEDSSTLFLTGKGDTTIFCYEVAEEHPYLNPLSHHRSNGPHQGLTFLSKHACDVQSVEFAKALRLTDTSVEPLSFTVPRIKSEYFQDDLFPPTKVMWKPAMTSAQWLKGNNVLPKRVSLKPENMELLSANSSQSTPAEKEKIPGITAPALPMNVPIALDDTTKWKQQQLEKAMSSKMQVNTKLEQDTMEGVEESEWVE